MRLRYKIPLILFGIAFALIAAIYLALFKFGLLEYLVNRKISDALRGNLPLRIHIEKIDGDYRSYLAISGLSVIYDDSVNSYPLAYAPRIKAHFSIMDLYRGRYFFRVIAIDSAQINLARSAEGKWLLPREMKNGKSKTTSVDVEIESLIIDGASVNLLGTDDTLSFSSIFLKAGVESREGTVSAVIDTLGYCSSEKKYSLRAAKGRATLAGSNVMCQNFEIATDSSELTIDGQATLTGDRSWRADISSPRLNVGEVAGYLGTKLKGHIAVSGSIEYKDNDIRGAIIIKGDLEDKKLDSLKMAYVFSNDRLRFENLEGIILDGCRIKGKGEINFSAKPAQYHLKGNIERFNLDKLVAGSFYSNLNGDIDMYGRGFSKKELAIDLFADLEESWFDKYHAYEAIGNMTITTDSIIFQDEFLIQYKDNLFTVSGKLEYSGDIQLNGSTMFDDLSAFNEQTFLKRMGGRADLDFQVSGAVKNPDIAGRFVSDSLWLYDIYSSQATVDFSLQHFLYDRLGTVALYLNNGRAYDHWYDTIRIQMRVDSQRVWLEESYIRAEPIAFKGTGTLNYAAYPQKLTLDSIALNVLGVDLKGLEPIEINVDSSGYDIARCRLLRETGHLEGTGRINYDQTLRLEVDAETIDIGPLMKLIETDYELSGLISGHCSLSGNFDLPQFSLKGMIDDLIYDNFHLGNLFAELKYADSILTIDSITVNSGSGYYIARGTLPANLTFGETESRLLDREQAIEISAKDSRLDAATLFLDEVENFKGDLSAKFKLGGTPRRPKVDGKINLANGLLKLYDLVLPIESLAVNMRMVDETVYIEKASGICKDRNKTIGRLTGEGRIVIKSIDNLDYDVKINAGSFPAYYELGDISAVADAKLKVYGETPPTVYGDVFIKSAQYRENFAEENDGWIVLTSLQADKTWDLNLNVEFPSNLWVKNDDIDAEFSGALNFIRDKGKYRYIGSLDILRGKGFLAGRVFRIETGGSINYEDIEYPNPRLDIYASTKIRGAAPKGESSSGSSSYDLRVHVTGTLDEPIISAAESEGGSPQFSTEEIIPLIFTDYYGDGEAYGNLTSSQGVGGRLTSGLSGFLSGQVSQIGSRTLGVETFEIDPVYGDKFDPLGTKLTLGFYTHPNLYIYGRSAISGTAGQEVGFEYRLKRFLLVEGSRDEENLYHLLLNFYWDY
jgi:autotransporter translocation and assembly factor TamB